MRFATRIALAAAAAGAAIFGLAAPAAAADYTASTADCAVVRHDVGIVKQTVYVRNVCSQPITFRVHRTFETSPCLVVLPGKQGGWRWNRGPDYHYTELGC